MLHTRAYEEVQRETLEGRELEASVLFRGAQKLKACARNWDNGRTKEFQESLTEALQFNQKLWSFLQVELSDRANPLPETLRLNLLRLSKFIDKQIFTLFAGGGTAESLLSIARVNEQIAQGLQVNTPKPPKEEDEPAPASGRLFDVAG